MATRQPNRRQPVAPAKPSPRVRDFGRPGSPIAVEWDLRTAYDFLFSLSDDAGSTDDLPAADRRWLAQGKAGLREKVADALDLYGSELCISLATLAVDRPEVTDAASFLALIESADPAVVMRTIAAEDLRDPARSDLTERAMRGDGAAIEQLVSHYGDHMSGEKLQRFALLYREPALVLAQARLVLAAWLPLYQQVEARVGSMLRRDVDLRSHDRRSLDAAELIERTTGGIRWLSEPGIERVILAPSYFARPYNFVLAGSNWRMFGYPIADEALDANDPLAPPATVVRLHRALGDETRLRILRLLRDRDWYLTEIAERLELSKPTIKHHLALLRSAGLVTLIEEGGLSYYNLRRERLDDASRELKHFLVD